MYGQSTDLQAETWKASSECLTKFWQVTRWNMKKIFFLGDFNFSRKHSAWDEFDCYIDELNLINHVKIPFHVNGNTLDLVLSNIPVDIKVKVDPVLKSDHFCLTFDVDAMSNQAQPDSTYKF